MNKFKVEFLFYLIHIYSIFEIKYKKLLHNIKSYFMNKTKTENQFATYVDTINNTNLNLYYDHINATKNNTNVLICKDKNSINNNYKVSHISFIHITFTVDDINYFIIDLKKPYNYYIVGNILNKSFFIYYLTHTFEELHLQKILLDNAKIHIIDHNVNIVDLKLSNENNTYHDFEIKIQENNYDLIIK